MQPGVVLHRLYDEVCATSSVQSRFRCSDRRPCDEGLFLFSAEQHFQVHSSIDGKRWSAKYVAMLRVICLTLSLVGLSRGQTSCGIQVPPKDEKFQIYLKGFRWRTPLDNYNGTKPQLSHGETISFTCDNGFINNNLLGNTYTFECVHGRLNRTFLYEDLFCKSDFHKDTKAFPVSSVQLGSALLKCEGKSLQVYEVRATKSDGHLKHLYTVCFDKKVMRTKFVLQPRRSENPIYRRESRRDVWGFDYFGETAHEKLKLSDGYVSRIQKRRITSAFPQKYNKNNKYPYTFNRGHLAPYSDFNAPEDKRASCEYLNVAPQWNELNGNSWSLVERGTRDLVRNNPESWEIYTGTYGHIPTTKGPLFVSSFFDKNSNSYKNFVPVPKLYWKIVHNFADKNCSRVFIGVNNPELKSPEDFTDKYLICTPKVNEKGTLYRGNEFKGFVYECDLGEFLEKLGKDEGIVRH